jgi:hypothetical protein
VTAFENSRLGNSPSILRTRRSFLKAVGASALAYPFLRSLELSAVEAADGAAPQRLITFYYPHGASSPLFRRQETDTEDKFDLAFKEKQSGALCVLSPFDDATTFGSSFKSKLVVVDGLDFVSGAVGHDGTRAVFTGSGINGKGSSIEQYLAVEAGLGKTTPFSSVVLGVGDNGTDHTHNVAYSKGVSMPKVIDPSATFKSLFASLAAAGDPAQAGAVQAQRARGQSVVDYLKGDIQRLSARLAPREKAKLDQHLTSITEIEKQLAAFEMGGGGATCKAPATPAKIDKLLRYNGGEPNFETITNLQIDMLAAAMACDLTRFGSFFMNDLSAGAVNGTGITEYKNDSGYDVHNTVAHQYQAPYDGTPGTPASWALLGVQMRYAYSKSARLLSKLAAGGVLDSSLVVISTDMGDTNGHNSDNVPYVLAGSAGGKLRTGRYVSLKANCPPGNRYCMGAQKTVYPNNRLFVSIAQMFGQQVDSFGETTVAADSKGALTELA